MLTSKNGIIISRKLGFCTAKFSVSKKKSVYLKTNFNDGQMFKNLTTFQNQDLKLQV